MILAIETSCDDTCAAVVTRAGEIRSNVVSSQGVHDRFGGVVPMRRRRSPGSTATFITCHTVS